MNHDRPNAYVVGQVQGGLKLDQMLGPALRIVGGRGDSTVDEVNGQVNSIADRFYPYVSHLGIGYLLRPEAPGAELKPSESMLSGEIYSPLSRTLGAK